MSLEGLAIQALAGDTPAHLRERGCGADRAKVDAVDQVQRFTALGDRTLPRRCQIALFLIRRRWRDQGSRKQRPQIDNGEHCCTGHEDHKHGNH
jgi:hypothetical protein